jgi:hypothetical protein
MSSWVRLNGWACRPEPETGARRRWSGNEPHAGDCGSQIPGSGSGSGAGSGGHQATVLMADKCVSRLTGAARPGISPSPSGEGCWRLSGASGASGVRARVDSPRPRLSRRRTLASASEMNSSLQGTAISRSSPPEPSTEPPPSEVAGADSHPCPHPVSASRFAGRRKHPSPGGEGDHLESLFSKACERVR